MIGFEFFLLALILTAAGLVYFFQATAGKDGDSAPRAEQRVRILVKEGYRPAEIQLRAGVPAVLEFYRAEDDPCSERLIIDGFNRNVFLAPHAATRISLMPERQGEFEFACGMGKLKGVIRVV